MHEHHTDADTLHSGMLYTGSLRKHDAQTAQIRQTDFNMNRRRSEQHPNASRLCEACYCCCPVRRHVTRGHRVPPPSSFQWVYTGYIHRGYTLYIPTRILVYPLVYSNLYTVCTAPPASSTSVRQQQLLQNNTKQEAPPGSVMH